MDNTALRQRLNSRFPEVDAVFDDHVARARTLLGADEATLLAWVDLAGWLGRLGRGVEPLLVALETLPEVLHTAGVGVLQPLRETLAALQKSPDGRALGPLLQSLPAVARRLPSGPLGGSVCAATCICRSEASSVVSMNSSEILIPSPGLACAHASRSSRSESGSAENSNDA